MSTSENVESEKPPVHGENNGIDQLETEETTLTSVISLPAESDQTEQRQETPAHSTEADVSHKERTCSTSPSTPLSKITILLKPTADAPIMKQKKWDVEPEKKMGAIIEFIKKYLKLQKTDSLFLYVSQSFAPAPDQVIKNLYDCFGADGKLVLHYCKSQAWG